MKAVVQTRYGSPDVLRVQDVPQPAPKAGEVLICVRAASLTPSDSAFRKGDPFLIRLMYGVRKPRLLIGGVEFAGDVSGIGEGVTLFQPGNAVFGMSPDRFGAHGEYLCLPEAKPIIRKPDGMSYADAVSIADGPCTALTYLRDVAHLQPGQRVLVNGASGSVGAAAVQLAKHYGAHVTGVCSTRNLELVRSLGADAVIDYTHENFTRCGKQWDVIFDAVGKSSFGRCRRALTPKGVYMTTVPTLGTLVAIVRTAFGGRKAKFTTAGLKQTKDNLSVLAGLYETGQLRAVIDCEYPLDDVPDAHRYVEAGHKRGSVVIQVAA